LTLFKNYQLLEFLESNYSKLGTIKQIKKIKHKNINSVNYQVTSTKTNYVLRNYTDESSINKIESMCKILNHCLRKNAKVPKPIKNNYNHFGHQKEKLYLTKYYPGYFFTGKTKELQDLAKNIANLHKALASNKISYNYHPKKQSYCVLKESELKIIKKKIIKKNNTNKFDKIVLKNLNFILKLSSKR